MLVVCLLNVYGGFLLLLVYWDSGWYGVSFFRCKPRVCVFSPQHNDTRDDLAVFVFLNSEISILTSVTVFHIVAVDHHISMSLK